MRWRVIYNGQRNHEVKNQRVQKYLRRVATMAGEPSKLQ